MQVNAIDVLACVGAAVIVITFAAVAWKYTGKAMNNYAECGAVFLCSAQH